MGDKITNDDLFTLIQNGNKSITEKIDDIKQEITEVKAQLNEKIPEIEQRLDKLQAENLEFKIRQLSTERQLKKHNLIFYGIPENPEESLEDTLGKVHDIILSKLKINLNIGEISNCFRLGKKGTKTRPVLVAFISIIKRREILYKRSELRGTRIFVNEDLIPEDRQTRKVLVEKFKEAKAHDKTATLKGDKLIVNGITYTYKDFVQDSTTLIERDIACFTPPSRVVHSEPPTPSNPAEQNEEGKEDVPAETILTVSQKVVKTVPETQTPLDPGKKRKFDPAPAPGKETGATPKRIATYPTRSRNNSNK